MKKMKILILTEVIGVFNKPMAKNTPSESRFYAQLKEMKSLKRSTKNLGRRENNGRRCLMKKEK